MIKLATPFGYEEKLSALAEALPLNLQDGAKGVIQLPLCDTQPAGSSPPAIGRFLRCNKSGGLLKDIIVGYTSYEKKTAPSVLPLEVRAVTFSQVVEIVQFHVEPFNPVIFKWVNPDGSITLKTMVAGGKYELEFRGTTIYILNTSGGITSSFSLYGFYN